MVTYATVPAIELKRFVGQGNICVVCDNYGSNCGHPGNNGCVAFSPSKHKYVFIDGDGKIIGVVCKKTALSFAKEIL